MIRQFISATVSSLSMAAAKENCPFPNPDQKKKKKKTLCWPFSLLIFLKRDNRHHCASAGGWPLWHRRASVTRSSLTHTTGQTGPNSRSFRAAGCFSACLSRLRVFLCTCHPICICAPEQPGYSQAVGLGARCSLPTRERWV